MKIALVNDTFLEGRGADTVIYELARRLGKKHEVYVIAAETRGFKEENFKIIKINAEKLYTGTSRDYNYFLKIIRFRKEIKKLQKKYGFDVFNVHHSSLNPAFLGLPAIVTWHGSPKTDNKLRQFFNKIILLTLNFNKATITLSQYLKSDLKKFVNKKKIEIIPDGVSEEFKPKRTDKNYMLFVGRCEPHKRIDEIIKISKETDFPLIIVGSGPNLEKLKDYTKDIGAKKVLFLGKVNRKKLIDLYQKCSFFISASRWEGFGLIFLEAAACGKSSLAYNLASIPEVVINKKTGFLAENYDELKELVKQFIKNKKLRQNIGKNALEFSKKFNWKDIAEAYAIFLNKKFILFK